MKKYWFLLICILFLPSLVMAMEKEDILNYVQEQQVCDTQTKQMLNRYTILFSRMLKEKNLKEHEVNQIYTKIEDAVNLLKQYDVCQKSDLDHIPKEVKETVKNSLYDAVMILYNASSTFEETSQESGIVLDQENHTIDIYQNGSLFDKVEISQNTFTYVGPNKTILFTIVISFFLSIVSFLIYRKKILADFTYSFALFSFGIGFLFFIFIKPITSFLSLSSMLKKPEVTVSKEIIVDENHEIIRYPNYHDTYAKLKIASVGLEEEVTFGDSKEILNQSIGHTTTSYLPGEGGTILYSGHNYKLYPLQNIKWMDTIEIDTKYGTFTYQVENVKIMTLDEYDSISITQDKEILVLYTCYPFSSYIYGNQRYVIFSHLIKEEWGE